MGATVSKMNAVVGGLRLRLQVVDGFEGTDTMDRTGFNVLYGGLIGGSNAENIDITSLAAQYATGNNVNVVTTTSANEYRLIGLFFGV